ncbi:hypothetical protein FB567DRAFT_132245 [Paraphoma chrysanthemicola]|uniref:F-box domain-containing protein n=1 Tax=Paraphoma chrysanthemicola TaxID=798071 RepID=A0A8K0R0L5_9PLEO|nr:hypothetical protein FB567DRAFT_132245 [Paraphoma chrysanthemicola]
MSLSTLSTELDEKILSFLINDTQSLSTCCLVSKYYHSIAEPYLYKHITLAQYSHAPIQKLCYTLLARPALAAHILRITVVPAHAPDLTAEEEDSLGRELWSHLNTITDAIYSIVTQGNGIPTNFPRFYVIWKNSILPDQPSRRDDAILALVVCMARNIERIDLHHEPVRRTFYRTTRWAMSLPWRGAERPFSKLRTLVLSGPETRQGAVPLVSGLKTFELRHSLLANQSLGGYFQFPLGVGGQAVLRRLVFVDVGDVYPMAVREMVQSGAFAGLEELVIDCCRPVRTMVPFDDFDALIETLVQHVPNLRTLRWTNRSETGHGVPGFSTFQSLKNLRQLHVDRALLHLPASCNMAELLYQDDLFPSGLTKLTLDGLNWSVMLRFVEELQHMNTPVDEGKSPKSTAFKVTSLERFAFITEVLGETSEDSDVHTWRIELGEKDTETLKSGIDFFRKSGVEFQVYKKPQDFDDELVSLIKNN